MFPVDVTFPVVFSPTVKIVPLEFTEKPVLVTVIDGAVIAPPTLRAPRKMTEPAIVSAPRTAIAPKTLSPCFTDTGVAIVFVGYAIAFLIRYARFASKMFWSKDLRTRTTSERVCSSRYISTTVGTSWRVSPNVACMSVGLGVR